MESPQDQALRASSAESLPSTKATIGSADRHLQLRIASDGSWHYRGSPIGRIELVKLFASVLRRESDGSFWLVTPVERGRIKVEDVPFVAVELERSGSGPQQELRLRTNLDAWLDVGPEHPLSLRTPAGVVAGSAPAPYVEVRDGLLARVVR
ncbi:MAG: DUF1285 domain-containing protein, partial [Pseudomonadota bacterium]